MRPAAINGRQITVVAYDDEFNAETAVKVVTRLVQTDNVDAIIGSMSSANILATADIVEEAQVLEIGCGNQRNLDQRRLQLCLPRYTECCPVQRGHRGSD